MTLIVRVRPTGWEQIPEETVQIKILRIPKKYLKFVEFWLKTRESEQISFDWKNEINGIYIYLRSPIYRIENREILAEIPNTQLAVYYAPRRQTWKCINR